VNFKDHLTREVAGCEVLLAVIGPRWLDARDDKNQRRLDDPNDFVRIEISVALKRNIPIIPVLFEGAKVPDSAQLPEDLRELAFRNGLDVRHASFHSDMDRLVGALSRILEESPDNTGRASHTKAKLLVLPPRFKALEDQLEILGPPVIVWASISALTIVGQMYLNHWSTQEIRPWRDLIFPFGSNYAPLPVLLFLAISVGLPFTPIRQLRTSPPLARAVWIAFTSAPLAVCSAWIFGSTLTVEIWVLVVVGFHLIISFCQWHRVLQLDRRDKLGT
jgi:hypothetical protein